MDEKTKKGIDKTVEIRYNNGRARRGVAQFGRVLGLGPRCRRFESCRLDQFFEKIKKVLDKHIFL